MIRKVRIYFAKRSHDAAAKRARDYHHHDNRDWSFDVALALDKDRDLAALNLSRLLHYRGKVRVIKPLTFAR